MDLPVESSSDQIAAEHDALLRPRPDYGTLGPGSDLNRPPKTSLSAPQVSVAIVAGILCAIPFLAARSGRPAWEQVAEYLNLRSTPQSASAVITSQYELESLNHQAAQKQAELLLERAIKHNDGASDQISSRVNIWRRKLRLTPRLTALITSALNSNDLRVRAAAIEIELAAMNVAKLPSNVDVFAKEAESADQSVRNWGLWTLGLLGNRGVDSERVTEILIVHLHDANEESRHWAVESLALVGTDATIPPLLQTLHDDPSAMVRERAACSLAQSGMLSPEQRRSAIPQLLSFADDSSLDAATRAWVFHALRDITGKALPDETAAWRNWYGTNGGS
jgi:hypothetical protein